MILHLRSVRFSYIFTIFKTSIQLLKERRFYLRKTCIFTFVKKAQKAEKIQRQKKQFAGTVQENIHEGSFWSPEAAGRIFSVMPGVPKKLLHNFKPV